MTNGLKTETSQITSNFNEAAKQQAREMIPSENPNGIATKAEEDKRIATETTLREKAQRENQPPALVNEEAQRKSAEKEKDFQQNKQDILNQKIREDLQKEAEKKKKDEMVLTLAQVKDKGFER